MPPSIAASTGIDALCHLLECFTSTVANPVSDNAALIGLHKLVRHIERSVNQPQDLTAKLEMLWASWYGGAAINYSGTHRCMRSPIRLAVPAPAARGGQRHSAGALHAGGPPSRGGEVRSSLGPDPDADRTLSGREIPKLVAWLAALVKRLPLPDNLRRASVPLRVFRPSAAAQDVKRLMNNAPCSVSREEIAAIYQTLYPEHA